MTQSREGHPEGTASPGPAKTIAVKFCGGCNPTYDRTDYWERIQAAAGDALVWVGADTPQPDGILLLCGCHSVCPLKHYDPSGYGCFVVVDSDRELPATIADRMVRKRTSSPGGGAGP